MRIRLTVAVDVDPKLWAENNGQIVDAEGRFTAADLRADVRAYVLHLIQTSTMVEDANGTAELS